MEAPDEILDYKRAVKRACGGCGRCAVVGNTSSMKTDHWPKRFNSNYFDLTNKIETNELRIKIISKYIKFEI